MFVLVACKPSAERETKKWQRNQTKVADLKAKYPQFRSFLDSDLKKASTAWSAAEKVAGEEEKAKAMEAANDIVDNKMVRQLSSIDYLKGSISDDIKKYYTLRMSKSAMKKARRQVQRAKDLRTDGYKLLSSADTSSRESAQSAIDDARAKFWSADSAASKAIKIAKGKK